MEDGDRRRHARALPGSAEALLLPDASVDAVVAGNAMHWFDMDVAGPEFARVLVSGGILSGPFNVIDDRATTYSRFPRGNACDQGGDAGHAEREAKLDKVRAFLARRPETAEGEFSLPMSTCVP